MDLIMDRFVFTLFENMFWFEQLFPFKLSGISYGKDPVKIHDLQKSPVLVARPLSSFRMIMTLRDFN